MGFAVIDFETTGLFPENGDRVVEVGVVLTNDEGRVEHEWTTLVNPRRHVGASHIHGLRGEDLWEAPEFAEVADQILNFVSGRTVVAHNASFDMRCLKSEMDRVGYNVSCAPPALCSMKWAGQLVGPGKLQQVCEALGVELIDAHSAMADARATAGILAHLIPMARGQRQWKSDVERSRNFAWPETRGHESTRIVPRGVRKPDSPSWLQRVLNATWIPGVPENEALYLLALERMLLDKSISISEGQQLVEISRKAGLSGSSIKRLHLSYLQSAAHEALTDGVVTAQERGDLISIAEALGLSASEVDDAIASASITHSKRSGEGSFILVPGDRIVFTGEMCKDRDVWVAEIKSVGLTSGGVNKSTKLVVSADPNSLSGKAKKARDYFIPIVDEDTFTRLLDQYKARL